MLIRERSDGVIVLQSMFWNVWLAFALFLLMVATASPFFLQPWLVPVGVVIIGVGVFVVFRSLQACVEVSDVAVTRRFIFTRCWLRSEVKGFVFASGEMSYLGLEVNSGKIYPLVTVLVLRRQHVADITAVLRGAGWEVLDLAPRRVGMLGRWLWFEVMLSM